MRWWTAAGAAALTGVMLVQPAAGQTTALAGVIDFHVHSGPDSRPRSVSDLEIARLAKRAGMRGLVFKNHFTMTADRAWLAMQEVPGIEIFGGVALNHSVGGLNAEAVRQLTAFAGGRGKVVWLPTFDAEFWMTRAGDPGEFVPVMRGGAMDPALGEIFDLIAEHDLVLAMGHSSPEEVLALIPEARRRGVEQILVTHGLGQQPTPAQLRAMADHDVVIELVWLAVLNGEFTYADYARVIREYGARHFLLASDLGQAGNPLHPDGLNALMDGLRGEGVSDAEIDLMIRENPARLLGLEPTGAAVAQDAWTAPRTPDGQPDLQGLWTNSTTTPLERPADVADRAVYTAEEVAAIDAANVGRNDRPPPAGDPGTYNDFWWERGTALARTSLVVDPADGRLPPRTAAGDARAGWTRGAGSWTDRSLAERCVTRGAPKRPGGYNNHFLVLQTPGYVVLLQEMIHEPRIIPLDGRPPVDARIRLWMGDSRGRWEGGTLVVETTNFRDDIYTNSFNCCPGASGGLTLVERFTRVDADTIEHRYSVNDPDTYTRPWTASVPMRRFAGPMYEYACHEGNYGMENLLRGARVQEGPAAAR